jgi:amino acid adenylation domain-containing protein
VEDIFTITKITVSEDQSAIRPQTMLLHQYLELNASQLTDKTAVVCDNRLLTYNELDTLSNRLGNYLLEIGLKKGDRVAIFINNSLEAVIGIFASLKAGCVFTIINHTTKYEKLVKILNNCQAKAILIDSRYDSIISNLQTDVRTLTKQIICGTEANSFANDHEQYTPLEKILDTSPSHRPQSSIIDRDLACLIYTSGSTGDPKGVMSDHSNVVFAANSIITYLENVESDIVLNALPLSFDYGLYQLFMTIIFGGTLILEKSFAFPAAILNQIEKYEVTGFPGVPTIFSLLLQMDLNAFDLSSLRYITNTAAALPPDHLLQLQDLFPGVKIFSMYGLTETKRTLYLPPDQITKRPASVGIAIPGTEVWIEGVNGKRLEPGEIGELVIRGRHVMRGYWGDKEASEKRFRPGPLCGEMVCYSGDLFFMDEEGYLYFSSRKDDMIKSRGEKVSPVELEKILFKLPGVIEAAVIGVPDHVMGQAIKAFVVFKDQEISEREVLRFCRNNLEDYAVPKEIVILDSLPKTSSGKIDKKSLF